MAADQTRVFRRQMCRIGGVLGAQLENHAVSHVNCRVNAVLEVSVHLRVRGMVVVREGGRFQEVIVVRGLAELVGSDALVLRKIEGIEATLALDENDGLLQQEQCASGHARLAEVQRVKMQRRVQFAGEKFQIQERNGVQVQEDVVVLQCDLEGDRVQHFRPNR